MRSSSASSTASRVNPDNGSTTEGKTGLMRCRDGEGGPVLREQELQQGKFMGVVRYYKDGALEREYRVNEKGNRDGLAREWARAEPGAKPVLVKEETLRDSRTVGIARSWYPSGQLRRVSFHGDEEREQASAEFTSEGKLADLRCAAKPVLGADFDDRAACGFAGGASTVTLYSGKGVAKARLSFERGERRKSETLWDSGAVRESSEQTAAAASSARSPPTARSGARCSGRRSPASGRAASPRSTRNSTRAASWCASAAGALPSAAPSCSSRRPGTSTASRRRRASTASPTGARCAARRASTTTAGRRSRAAGKAAAAAAARCHGHAADLRREGRLRGERIYDERGRIKRERELDERGNVVRDDEVFEDGSRKAVGR
jgi:hypothetical protein